MSAPETRVEIARELSTIVQYWRDLVEEALFHYADKDIPGGAALLYATPAANVEAWQHRYETAEREAAERRVEFDARYGGRDYAADQEAELHPLLVLGTWEDAIRDERDQPTDLRATVERAAAYIRDSIDWMMDTNEHGDQNFLGVEQLVKDLHSCRASLETLLKAGTRITRGAPCLHCTNVNLVRVEDARQGLQDKFFCPACRREYNKASYDYVVGQAHLHNAHELTADQIEQRTDIPASKVRVWGTRYDGLKTKKNPEGRWLYDVASVLAKANELDKVTA